MSPSTGSSPPPDDHSTGVLHCPHVDRAGDNGCSQVHLTSVDVVARVEDGPANVVRVATDTGAVQTHLPDELPTTSLGSDRRYRVLLNGYCEGGHLLTFVYNQHKGTTYTEVTSEDWDEDNPPWKH